MRGIVNNDRAKGGRPEPFQGSNIFGGFDPRVALNAQPWAKLSNAFGVTALLPDVRKLACGIR